MSTARVEDAIDGEMQELRAAWFASYESRYGTLPSEPYDIWVAGYIEGVRRVLGQK